MRPRSRRERGVRAEQLAREFLEQKGLTLVTRNYRTRRGEIDLIMKDRDTIVFVEVRARAHAGFMDPAESVDAAKQARIMDTGRRWLQQHKLSDRVACRFDVILCTGEEGAQNIRWIADAFAT